MKTHIGIGTILTSLFVTLKLLSKISWSWWWVCSPAIVEWSIAVLMMLVMTSFACAITALGVKR